MSLPESLSSLGIMTKMTSTSIAGLECSSCLRLWLRQTFKQCSVCFLQNFKEADLVSFAVTYVTVVLFSQFKWSWFDFIEFWLVISRFEIWFRLIKHCLCSDLCHIGDRAVVELNLLPVHSNWRHLHQSFLRCQDLLSEASQMVCWWWQERPKHHHHHEGDVILRPPRILENNSQSVCHCFPQILLPHPPGCARLSLQRNHCLPAQNSRQRFGDQLFWFSHQLPHHRSELFFLCPLPLHSHCLCR